ncbi:structural protein MipA [Sphingomonas oleivorans]|uniref:Structural protein MipA n=1 Tax=Sphingomonas oleivorans TaxID=1735121 RepID=A0A2T5G2D5_9SPHN|nr:MipA/OmpV family protein [Sphingomonas oleivorans]PTQ13280.1 structural protein MipA [Sphingomonas oleivorans]
MQPRILPLLLLAGLGTTPALAQNALAVPEEDDGWSGLVALGPGATPEYEGADSYRLIPFAIADVRREGIAFQMRGLRARLALGSGGLVAGPVVNMRLSRDDDVGGSVSRMAKIDSAVELGGFVGYRFGGDARGQGEVQLDLTDLFDASDTHDGFLLVASASYAALRADRFSLSVDAQTTYGDKKYTRTYFGVTPADSAASGLAAYRPGASLRDVGVGGTLGYRFDDHWGLLGRLSYTLLVGDAADSPVVRDAGSRHQGQAGLALSYRF